MSHLTPAQRYTISVMLEQKFTQKVISAAIGKDKSVVSREIRRNADGRSGKYHFDLAQRKYEKRLQQKPKHKRFTPPVQAYVESCLQEQFSPEQIVAVAQQQGQVCVSHERIYQHIWQDKKQAGTLHEHLRSKGKKYRQRGAAKDRRGCLIGRIPITERPAIVAAKGRFGDLEIDTIIGQNHQGAIVTINDRATGMLKMKKIEKRTAQQVEKATLHLLTDWKEHLHTITADNGKEFANHQAISQQLQVAFYFATPYHSWERGANENLNGLIRQYIPKQTDFTTLTEEYIQQVEDKLNKRPRKRHLFQAPLFVFNKLVNAANTVALVT